MRPKKTLNSLLIMFIYESDFFELIYHKEQSIFESRWRNSEQINDEIFKKNLLEYARLAQRIRPKNYLVDNTDLTFTISVQLQEWINTHIFPLTAHADVRKFAIVLSQDLFAKVSLVQVVEDGASQFLGTQTRYFHHLEEARRWITQK